MSTTTTAKSIKGTQTEKNLVLAYLSESAAYTRYTFYAQQAEKESYFPIQRIFEDTAANELHHAKIYFKYLEGGQVDVTMGGVDAGIIGTTEQNLEIAAQEELVEGTEQYQAAAKVAEEEGFGEIAAHFRAIAEVEASHRRRFLHYLKQVKDGTVWKRDKAIVWKCLVCGYEFTGTEPPMTCPACNHPYQHYMAMDYEDII